MARFKRLLRRALFLFAGLALLGFATLGILYWLISPRLPDVQELRNVELQVPLSIYSRDGRLISVIGETRRFPVDIEDVPERVKQTFIAIEDARFYEHPGVDWRGIARAVWLLATTDGRVPGGSTITQQVARQFFLSTEYSYTRKLTEIFLALKMERELSKDEILELYLNKSFFGNRAYGIAAAAEYYYGKPLDQLTLAEAATLASIPKFPSSGNPIINPERALVRRNYVLQRMREEGMITEAEEREAQAAPMNASPHEPKIEVEAPYVAEMVRAEMEQRFGAEATTSGLSVYTTLDGDDQMAAVRSLQAGLLEYDRRHGYRGPEARLDVPAGEPAAEMRKRLRPYPTLGGLQAALVTGTEGERATLLTAAGNELELDAESTRWTRKTPAQLFKRGDVVRLSLDTATGKLRLAQIPAAQAALVSLQPEDGAVRALVGGFSFGLNKFNRATQAQRLPGSSFKPFVYAASFERGFSPASIVLDAPVVFRDRAGNVWRPQNDAGNFAGPMRLREAMVQSRNLVSVRLLDAIGVDFASRYITQFGFSQESLPPNLSMALGTSSLTPLSIARGYTVIVNGGYLVEPWFIDRVVDRNGQVISQHVPARACRNCAGTEAQGARDAPTVVDGFDFGPSQASAEAAPTTPEAGADAAPPAADGQWTPAPRAIDERTAFLVHSMLRDVVRRGTGASAKVIGRDDLGGKTGSTNEYRDAWFSGFGGDLVTTVWVGKDDFSSLGRGEYGGKAALPIWIGYMGAALKDVPVVEPAVPSGVLTVWVDAGTGRLVPEASPGSVRDYVKREDYERMSTAGFDDEPVLSNEEAFDIF
ncbi:penicillin-binding protein 1A [Arenimonas caeni]|jgi:penicillin-binding protein 1A|uniref:penicillin-binding protein 1A n=1 Tax=Arenimonas caeni TaxID=2058085 RepID=UPI002A35BFE4|nr:penicillin-binding protein 1A [Arenimonas caeni]MDY0022999.1 penicillin-binding protein 1A [Arenimonas caeni]